mgnify:FL=1
MPDNNYDETGERYRSKEPTPDRTGKFIAPAVIIVIALGVWIAGAVLNWW